MGLIIQGYKPTIKNRSVSYNALRSIGSDLGSDLCIVEGMNDVYAKVSSD